MPRAKKNDTTPAPKRRTRAAKVVEDEDVENEEEEVETTAAPKRRGRKAKPADTAAPKRRGRKAKPVVDDEDEDEAPAPKRRGRKAKPVEDDEPKKSQAKNEYIYVDDASAKGLWDELDGGIDTRVAVSDESKNPRGKRQKEAVEFIESKGRKKVTAQQVIDDLIDNGSSNAGAEWCVANCLNVGVIEAQ